MKVAITIWENRVSPVADSAREVLVVEVGGGRILRRRQEHFDDDSLFNHAGKLSELSVKIFICGAISDFYGSLVEGYGIRLIPFVYGQVDDVLNAFASNSLKRTGLKRRCSKPIDAGPAPFAVLSRAELAQGRSPEEITEITGELIISVLGGLPEEDHRCAFFAAQTLQEALDHYMKKQRRRDTPAEAEFCCKSGLNL
jgi:predicted Fe-Mo cluster-binding NifX family protein